jgi:porphyrinogen peroxidase
VQGGDRSAIAAQTIEAPLSRFAVFLVVIVRRDAAHVATAVETVAGVEDLIKTVGFRDLDAHLSCIVGLGSDFWDVVSPGSRPAELAPFDPVVGATHTAPSTPGDLLFHVRAERYDLCFEFTRLLLAALGDAVEVQDETHGFRYFDARDLLGFVDGTANPSGPAIGEAALVGDEDPAFAGGSYVVVQRYVHDLDRWAGLGVDEQERVVGRTKVDNVELPDAGSGQRSHKTLATVTDDDGAEHDILRDNMPFGAPGSGVYGTYFIGYAGRLWVIRRMLERMFLGDPPGRHDRILDVSTATTGTVFFAPSATMLAALPAP